MFRAILIAVSLSALLCVEGQAQQQQIPQVVQLPTFSFFSVSTTVSVPDSGSAYLGGVNRSRTQSSTRGVPGLSQLPYAGRLFRNRGIASSATSSGARASATIIDHSELDEMMLSEAAARRGGRVAMTETERKAAFLTQHVARRDDTLLAVSRTPTATESGPPSVDIEAAKQAAAQQVALYLDRGRRAEKAGNVAAARCSYRVVARRGSEQQKQFALARLAALETADRLKLAAKDG